MTHQASDYFFVVSECNRYGPDLLHLLSSPILAFDVDNQGRAILPAIFAHCPIGDPKLPSSIPQAAAVVASTFLPNIAASLPAPAWPSLMNAAQDLFLAVSPAPLPVQSRLRGPTGRRASWAPSYLFLLRARCRPPSSPRRYVPDAVRFHPARRSGNAYAFGHGTGAIPTTTIQPLAAPCSEAPASFVLEGDSAGTVGYRQLFPARPTIARFPRTRPAASCSIAARLPPPCRWISPPNPRPCSAARRIWPRTSLIGGWHPVKLSSSPAPASVPRKVSGPCRTPLANIPLRSVGFRFCLTHAGTAALCAGQ